MIAPLELFSNITGPITHTDAAVPDWDAAVLIAVTRAAQPELVFLKRAEHLTLHPGEVAFPGGKREPDDPSPVGTALRESSEEIGLPESRVEIIGQLPSHRSHAGLEVVPVLGVIGEQEPLRPCSEESELVFKVPVSHFTKEEPSRVHRIRRGEQTLFVPAWSWQNREIWGLSAMILVALLQQAGLRHFDLDHPPQGVKTALPYQD